MSIEDLKVAEENCENELCLVYVKHIGTDIDGKNIYNLLLSKDPDGAFSEDWGQIPAKNVPDARLDLEEDMYDYVVECRTDIKFDLAQHCSSFSMQDARDNIVALAFENVSKYDEYPEPRIILHFGENIEDIEKKFTQRNISLKYI